MTHKQIWDGIEKMAADHGMSTSGLAVAAGLDATAFNKGKRVNKNGGECWPTMRTIVKICKTTGVSFADFLVKYVGD